MTRENRIFCALVLCICASLGNGMAATACLAYGVTSLAALHYTAAFLCLLAVRYNVNQLDRIYEVRDHVARLARLSSLTHPAPQPFALLTEAQAVEVQGLRDCGFTFDELETYAPMWGLDRRAVAAERQRIEEALRG